MDISKAYEYARIMHEGQFRKDGSEYINHPRAVSEYLMDQGYGIEYQIAGLFHDLLEDTNATEDDILALSNRDVLTAVKLVTKTEGYDEQEYIDRILANPIAKEVKNADRIHNLMDAVNADRSFIQRYLKDTKEFYVGCFSSELDEAYDRLKRMYECAKGD